MIEYNIDNSADIDIADEDNQVIKKSRDYNFRRKNAIKEQERLKHLYDNVGYWPNKPNGVRGEDGSITHYTPQSHSFAKGQHKRQSNKQIRRMPLDTIGSKGNYKKVYNLWYNWF